MNRAAAAKFKSMEEMCDGGRRDGELECSVCSVSLEGAHVVIAHAELGVALCGACNAAVEESGVLEAEDEDEEACLWCGGARGCETVVLCDTCPRAWCVRCVQLASGAPEVDAASLPEPWSCCGCGPSPGLAEHRRLLSAWERRQLEEAQEATGLAAACDPVDGAAQRAIDAVVALEGDADDCLEALDRVAH